MIQTKYVYSEIPEFFHDIVRDEITDAALRTSSYFDYWDTKISGYIVLVTIKSKAFIEGDDNSELYREYKRKEFPAFEKDLGFEPIEMERFIYLKDRKREKRGVKTLYNCRPVKFLGKAKKETLVRWIQL